MAAPTVSSLTDASSAFKYPLPTVRQLHKQIGTALDEKNARLRTLVGGSYRQLLGTAETIVDMRRDIEVAERKLERVADGCGRGVVGKKVAGLGKLGPARGAGIQGREGLSADLGWLARMKVLEGCMVAVRKLLRPRNILSKEEGEEESRGQKLVAAAKVLVLARLLLKSVGELKIEEAHTITEELRKRVGGLRRRLLNAIERTLQRVKDNRDELADALSAYSLATSSGAKDTLRHFLHIRGEAMALAFGEEDGPPSGQANEQSVVKALSLYTSTLLDVQALVPRRLSESLQGLKAKALLQDPSIRDLEALRLDVGERWFGDEIVYFTPYIRHDDLEGSQAVEMLRGWAKRASEVLLQGLKKALDTISEFKNVVDLRTKVFEIWIREGGKAKGFDSSVILDDLRATVNERLVTLIEARIAKLHLIGTEVEATLAGWSSTSGGGHSGLWLDEMLDMELNSGGLQFKKAIVSQVHGRDLNVSRVINSFETWRHLVDELFDSIAELRKKKWDDDLEILDDDLSLEDRNEMLSSDDPAMLQKRVDRSLKQAFYDLHDKLSTLSNIYREVEYNGAISIFILRVIREIRVELPKSAELQSFGLSLVPELQRTLAASVSSEAIAAHSKAFVKKRKLVGRSLWEGDLPLPVQPSPFLFRLLRDVTLSMATAGSDLWSPAAITILKLYLDKAIGEEWEIALGLLNSTSVTNGSADQDGDSKPLNGEEDHTEVGAAEKVESEQPDVVPSTAGDSVDTSSRKIARQESATQWLFDTLVLRCCLESSSSAKSETKLAGFVAILKTETDLAESLMKRLEQSAQDYWKRTSLLFGLLA